MAIRWEDLKGYIREAVLKDIIVNNSTPQFADTQLLIAARWACAALSMHTAQAFTYHIPADGTAYKFDLPANTVDGVEKAALVIYNNNTKMEYLAPVRVQPGVTWPTKAPGDASASLRGYFEWPQGVLVLTFVPAKDTEIVVHAFRQWAPPEIDDSLLEFPMAFEQPFSYMVGSLVLDSLGFQAAAIRTWNRKTDSGTPEDNSPKDYAKYLWFTAEERLKDIGPQDRETYYHLAPRDLGFER